MKLLTTTFLIVITLCFVGCDECRDKSHDGMRVTVVPGVGNTTVYYNSRITYTAECPQGFSGDSVTIDIADKSFQSTVSKYQADSFALAKAQDMAQSLLECEELLAPIIIPAN